LNYVYEKIPISEDEYNKLKEVLLEDENYMPLAWVVCAFNCGARRGGIVQFKVDCIKDGIPDGKTYVMSNKVREKGRSNDGKICEYMLNEECLEYINLWLGHRGYEHEFIFTTKYGGEIKQASREWADDICTNILSDILGRRINPHLFKASACTNLLEKGKDIKTVSKFICQHNSVETTMKYYDLRKNDNIDDLFN
jgi:integrase